MAGLSIVNGQKRSDLSIDSGLALCYNKGMESTLLKEVILEQRTWPFPKDYVPQIAYDAIRPFLNTPDIVVITGVRRCGKSTLLQALRQASKEGDYYLNFEDDRLIEFELQDFQKMVEAFMSLFGQQDTYYFDEIQNIPDWERFVRRLYNQGKKIFITGSNAELFSRELGTRLTGRYIPIETYPLSFLEIVRVQHPQLIGCSLYTTEQKGILQHLFAQYQESGGIPEFRSYGHPKYLHSLYESIIYRDIVARYKIPNDKPIKELVYLLAGAVGKPVTFNSLRKLIGIGSTTTISDYCSYLQGCYLCFFLNCYSPSLKRQMTLPKKVYFIDHALARIVGFRNSEDHGRLLENQVLIELKRRGEEIYYHMGDAECDFVLRQGTKIQQAIQVCAEFGSKETKNREINGLFDAMKAYDLDNGLILTANEEEKLEHHDGERTYRIHITPIWKWMLEPMMTLGQK